VVKNYKSKKNLFRHKKILSVRGGVMKLKAYECPYPAKVMV